jgi:hypothetical protein
MRKQPSMPVALTEADLLKFLDTQSDFAFELKALKALNEKGFNCEHGGTYSDPVTRKPRQFDIRAKNVWKDVCISLAVECKNLSDTSPLLVSCVPRSPAEAFHEVVPSFDVFHKGLYTMADECIRFSGETSIYKPDDPVGKSTERVAKKDDGTFNSSDGDVYEKWAQAVSSAQDLINRAARDKGHYTAIFPYWWFPTERFGWLNSIQMAHGSVIRDK